jgi:hypothetical protein
MRDINYLIQLFPNKTGKELLEIQEQDKLDDKKAQEKRDKKLIDFMNDINTNGGYFKGAFGTDQYYMYKIENVKLQNSVLYGDVEKIILFYGKNLKTSVLGKDILDFKIESKEFCNVLDYTEHTKRIKDFEYHNLYSLMNSIVPSFFEEDYKKRQKEFGKK